MKSLSRPLENLLITTVKDGPFFIDDLFQRKFSGPAPDHGHSVICFYRKSWDQFLPVSYSNFLLYDEVMLLGGVMTDGKSFGHMTDDLAQEIRASGGIYYHVLKFAHDHYKNQCEAYFAYSGDERSYEVCGQAGYEPTIYRHLIAYFHKPTTPKRKAFLIEKIHKFGPF